MNETLQEAAKAAFKQAYAPYSQFRVGAALLSDSGRVFFGANVENASYGLTRCAEQSAIQAMVSAGDRTFTQIVIYSHASPPATPCGACRQILFEFAPDADIFCINQDNETIQTTVKELLPYGFRLQEKDSPVGSL